MYNNKPYNLILNLFFFFIKLSKNNDHGRVSQGVESSQEDNRIPTLKSNR